ncbi:MAG TPA: metal-dependent hydrolase [Bdellovibrionales bacterium]|nr:metal-dependent hydrolase [Bdellovibrionales bacterium]
MDNVTHSLVGAVVGEWAYRAKTKREASDSKLDDQARRLWLWASVGANNFPDLDVLYTRITPGPLGSLLHHRGHTHTFLAVIPQWFIVMALLWLLAWPLRYRGLGRAEWRMAGVLAAFGLCLHVLADTWNSYGVHPFWPLSNEWIYGDAVFIIEPFLWAFFAAAILAFGRTRLRFVPMSLLAILLGAGLYYELVGARAAIVAATAAGLSWFFRKRPARTASLALIIAAVYILAHLAASRYIRHHVATRAKPGETVLDVVLSPVPASPLCWFTIRIATAGPVYEVKRGIVSLFPALQAAAACPDLGRLSAAGPQERALETLGPIQAGWGETYKTELSNFEVLKDHCPYRAWMRFARVPFITADGATDLRFSRRGMRNFADLSGGDPSACPPNIPPWVPPRLDVIKLVGGEAWFD